ncbi:MAG: glycosyltransferase family 39 protein [bacterium]|nr:glycosyltransferase family 39 protein [bacterium]
MRKNDWILPAVLAGVTALLHLATAADGWGPFRDELYYVACSENLSFGYVDHPPLVALLTRLARTLLGDSLLALRVLPALAAGVTVFLAGALARELGGAPFARALACVASALAPVYVGNFGFLSMNALDVMFWTAAVWLLARLLRTEDPRLWPAFGVVTGLGLQNKVSIVFLGLGVAAGILLTANRRWLLRRELWLGGAIAFLLLLPNLIWQALNDWPTREFVANATQNKNLPLAPLEFLQEQVLMMNPIVVPLALAGLGFLFLAAQGRWRLLGWAFVSVVVLLITQRSKAYYLSPAYTVLFAPGAVLLESLTERRPWRFLRAPAVAVVVLTGLLLAPLAKPVLPIETYVRYAQALGVAPSTSERKEVARLPQFFADRLGWRELAETVQQVVQTLPAEQRERACVFGQNYGHAGAIDFYADELDLPPALSGHNSYHLWGPGSCDGSVLIVIDDRRERLEHLFDSVELGARYRCDDCMPYESEKPIWIGRDMRLPIEQLWPTLGHYD